METRAVIDRFLAGKRIAVAGVSRNPQDFSRDMLKELLARGYDAIAVHPAGGEIDGRKVFARVQDIPERVDGVIVLTSPEVAVQVVHDCREAGVPRVWLHRGAGVGAVSQEAVKACLDAGIEVVPGECPFMFLGGSIHDWHRSVRRFTGSLPVAGEELRAAERANRGLLAALVALELFIAAGALYGGVSFLTSPMGNPMGMPLPGEMPGLPFSSWLVPGIVLIVANALFPLAVAIGALAGRPWAVRAHLVVGMVITGWIAVQVLMLGWISPLQPLVLSVGVAIFALGWLFRARKAGAIRHLSVVA